MKQTVENLLLDKAMHVLKHANKIFGDREKAKKWLNSEIRSLNYRCPIEYFESLHGLSMVDDILGRIEEGVYS